MLAVYAAALATFAASVLVGHAVRAISSFPRAPALAPAVGFAVLLAVGAAAAEVGGGATVALAFVAALLAVSLAVGALRGPAKPIDGEGAVVAAAVLLAAALPFLVSDRVGFLGMGSSNDMVDHLTGAYWLATGDGIVPRAIFHGYPVGPHGLAAALSRLGAPLPEAFMGIMFAAPALAAVAALAALPAAPKLPRAAAAVLVGIPYLVASYFVQGEFNEVMAGVLVFAFALALRELVRAPRPLPLRSAAPLGLLAGGLVSTYSYLGLVWPLTIVGFLFAIHVARARGSRAASARALAVRAAPLALVAALVLAGSAGAQALRMKRFAEAPYANTPRDRMGNLLDPVSPFTVLGVWPATDVRARPDDETLAAVASAAAFVAFVAALLWWARRRETAILAALGACALVYAQASLVKNPYAAAKALPVAAPLVALALAVPWLDAWRARTFARERRTRRRSAAIVAAGTVLAVAAGASSAGALRDAYVATSAHGEAVEALRPHVRGHPTLFLGYDDFAHWYLRGAELATVGRLYARWVAPPRPEKPWVRGHAFDFDTIAPGVLDAVRYVVAPASPYASSPPPNFSLRAENRWYRLWERSGPTPERRLAAGEIGAPGAVLDCAVEGVDTDAGVAAVLPPPIVGPRAAWRGSAEAIGGEATQVLELPAGRWDLTLQYASKRALRVRALDLETLLPANLSRVGPHWLLGTLDVERPTRVTVRVRSEHGLAARALGADAPTRAFSSPLGNPLGDVVATPHRWTPELVPLAQACGRYVDWYRGSGGGT